MTPKHPPVYDRAAFQKGSIIIKEGDTQAQAYLIQTGRVGVFTIKNDKKIELAVLETGEIVGEMALISDVVRTASVEALEDCTLILISRTEFEERLKASDRAIQAMVKMMSKRVAQSNLSNVGKIAALNNLEDAAAEVYEETRAEVPDINDERLLPKLRELLRAIEEFKARFVMENIERGYLDKDNLSDRNN
jgi:CRP-like cAMP-binding protein